MHTRSLSTGLTIHLCLSGTQCSGIHVSTFSLFILFFQGELEQLTVVDESFGGVSEQCSPNKVPFLLEKIAEKIHHHHDETNINNDFHIEESKTPEKEKKNDDHSVQKSKGWYMFHFTFSCQPYVLRPRQL